MNEISEHGNAKKAIKISNYLIFNWHLINWTADCQQMFKVASFYCAGLVCLQFSLRLGLSQLCRSIVFRRWHTSHENMILLKRPFSEGHVSRMTNFTYHPPPSHTTNPKILNLRVCDGFVWCMKWIIYIFNTFSILIKNYNVIILMIILIIKFILRY